MTDVHPIATGGYGRSADSYVRGRPDYPPAALDWLRSDLGLGPGQTALELGSGTGKFTRLLVETGADIAAVEPVAAMLDELRRSLPAVTALQGTAQRIPAADASADAVICAQAFHWFASADSLAEIHRVLKPGGMLGLVRVDRHLAFEANPDEIRAAGLSVSAKVLKLARIRRSAP